MPKGGFSGKESATRSGALVCALRELAEETGIGSDTLQMIDGFSERVRIELPRATRNTPTGVKNVVFFLARAPRGTPVRLSNEHAEFCWGNEARARQLLPPEQRPLLARAAAAARASLR
jgi:8-oxo-dGTP pyrophosphatase MutT (NUDIX family)